MEFSMGVREGLLALLDRAPTHGYQLRHALEETVGSLWSVNVGQVYSTLQRLERDELVVPDGEVPDEGGRLPYVLTELGRDEVLGWMRAPLPRRDDFRDELVLKLLLAWRTGLVDPLDVIDTQREATMAALQGFTRRRAELNDDQLGQLVALDRLALRARAELDWLDLVEERLARAGSPTGATE
jgi:DNA-binding PadR family transcriptional regulator